MTDFLALCQKHFSSKCFYDILEVSKTAKPSEIKKAYYKKSLATHPDKVEEVNRENATTKFQILSKIYSILQDEDKRVVYDETGAFDDDDFFSESKDWYDYWRCLFKKVSLTDIEMFEKEYKNSQEELEDLKKTYLKSKGCMETILNNMMCATDEDESRFRSILADLIEKKELPMYDLFLEEDEKKKKLRRKKSNSEAKEAEKMKAKLGLENNESSLEALILKRRSNQSNSIIATLEEKYGKNAKKKK